MYKSISSNHKIVQLSIWLGMLLSIPTAYANHLSYKNNGNQSYYPKDDWRLYPFTIQMNGHAGLAMPINLIKLPEEKPETKMPFLFGGSTDLSILYVKRGLWKHLNCYPRVGLTFNYHRLANEGNIYGGLLYIEPNYNHLTGWEFLPKLGVGVAYAQVPGHHAYDAPDDYNMPDIDDYMQGPALDLSLGMGVRYRITPKWHIYAGLGVNYLLAFTQETDQNDEPLPRKSLTLANLNIGSSYTFNPNPDIFIRTEGPRKSRIDLGTLHSVNKAKPPKPNPNQATTPNPVPAGNIQAPTKDNNLYYLGGLYAQGSLQIVNNHALTLGAEWIKNAAVKKETEKMVRTSDLQVSFLLGHEFLWGKITFGQAIGVYLHNEGIKAPFGSFYTRLTLNYHIAEFLFIGTSVKTAVLPEKNKLVGFDYVDFRLGYSFNIKY